MRYVILAFAALLTNACGSISDTKRTGMVLDARTIAKSAAPARSMDIEAAKKLLHRKFPDSTGSPQLCANLPSLDLNEKKRVSPAQDQGDCSSCWAMASTSAIETSWRYLKDETTLELSALHVRDCTWPMIDRSEDDGVVHFGRSLTKYDCDGGFFDGPFELGRHLGILRSKLYSVAKKTTPSNLICEVENPSKNPDGRIRVATWDYVRAPQTSAEPLKQPVIASKEEIKLALCEFGGVVSMVDSSDWQKPFKGEYIIGQQTPNPSVAIPEPKDRHAVQIVGWDDTYSKGKMTGFWIVKNSWGADWAQKGFVRIPYGHQSIGMYATWVFAADVDCKKIKNGDPTDAEILDCLNLWHSRTPPPKELASLP